jgi:hypothetical protein
MEREAVRCYSMDVELINAHLNKLWQWLAKLISQNEEAVLSG